MRQNLALSKCKFVYADSPGGTAMQTGALHSRRSGDYDMDRTATQTSGRRDKRIISVGL